LEKSGKFGVPNRILLDKETGPFIRHETGFVPGERDEWDSYTGISFLRKLIHRK
jgi:hypothetical protein